MTRRRPPEPARCADCLYFFATDWSGDRSPTYGECRRFPHPERKHAGMWCGEFTVKSTKETKP